MNSSTPLRHQLFAEFVGTTALLLAVIGSGIMAERLSGGNVALALLANTLATVWALYVLIHILSPVSGAHFNPVVTWISYKKHLLGLDKTRQTATFFIAIQLMGAVAGTLLAHAMFDLELLQVSTKLRPGWGQALSEVVATAGLVLVILRAPPGQAPALVSSYIGAAYWFTASTSFANPAAVLGRMLTDSFTGIAPSSAPYFVVAQVVGAWAGAKINACLGRTEALSHTTTPE